MKNSLIIILFSYFFLQSLSLAQNFKFETTNIEILESGNLIYATKGKATSSDGDIEIDAKNFEYNKELATLKAEGDGLAFINSENIKIEFDNALIDENKLTFNANGNIKIIELEKNFIIETESVIYDKGNRFIKSSTKTMMKDNQNNIYSADNFFYEINKNLLKLENVNFNDFKNNKFYTSLAYINTETNKLHGKDISADLNNTEFNKDNEPRLKGNSVSSDNLTTEITKGVFTTCKKRKDKCPPWQLSAEKIQHDKKKQVINYKNAWLNVYDVPVMYFPKFFHPDPTVKRRSGFLIPTIKNSPTSNNYLSTPYFFAIAGNKDATFSPRFYDEDKFLLQTEYRQASYRANHLADFSFFGEKDKDTNSHFFYKYNKNFDTNNFEENEISFKLQQTTNDTYLKANKLETNLISDDNILENSLNINFYSNDFSIDAETKVYEDLNKDRSDRYEYIIPRINLVKKLNNKSNLNGDFTLKSNNLIRNYNTNVHEKTNINDLIFSSYPLITKSGFYNNYDFIIKNSNTDTENSNNYKENENYYFSSLFQYNSSLPLIKENESYQNILKPKLAFKISPKTNKDISDQDNKIDVNNIYSINRISENDILEGGLSLTFGNDYSIFDKRNSREILGIKLANNLRLDENKDLPKNNQIGQKTSNIFGEISINPVDFISTKYNAALKNNVSDISYENLITKLTVNNLVTTFDYLNENNTVNQNNYLTTSIKYTLDDSNNLIFSTRENKTSDLTEYYNLMYQYKNDCLAASIEYNKDYYNDRDIKPSESVFFKLTIIPFGETSSPNLKN